MEATKSSMKIALAYVGIIVGAGLSSGRDLLQYFVGFGLSGILGAFALGALNVIFGRIILALGALYRASDHAEALGKIASPALNAFLDFTLGASCFAIGFVMIAGAGANAEQQFGAPAWLGALICSLLVIGVSFMNFDKITRVLGFFTPAMVVLIAIVAASVFGGEIGELSELEAAASSIKPAAPNVWLAVINYFSLCAITGVSMSFVLGGSLVRISVAEKGGAIGGAIIGAVVACASAVLFVKVAEVKDASVPMLTITEQIHPAFAFVYAIVIFALIFNTAFSLFYSVAKRLAGANERRFKILIIGLVAVGYGFSFCGFKELIATAYPILGYAGLVLLAVLGVAWIRKQKVLAREKKIRLSMINLLLDAHKKGEWASEDKEKYHELGVKSVADTEEIKQGVKELVKKRLKKKKRERAKRLAKQGVKPKETLKKIFRAKIK